MQWTHVVPVPGRALAVVATLALMATGCCMSSNVADQMKAQLRASNRQHAEPAMRSAAAALGAELLPVMPRQVYPVPPCESMIMPEIAPRPRCVNWESDDRRAFRVVGERGAMMLGVRVRSPAWYYARLARRKNALIILVPRVSRHLVSHESVCECHESYGNLFRDEEDRESVFLIRDVPLENIVEVQVPITEDFIDWRCNTTHVAAECEDLLGTETS